MSVLVYIESENGAFKKAALEVASYGRAVANALNTSLNAVVFDTEDCTQLGTYGVDKVLSVNHSEPFNAKIYAARQKRRFIKIITQRLRPQSGQKRRGGHIPGKTIHKAKAARIGKSQMRAIVKAHFDMNMFLRRLRRHFMGISAGLHIALLRQGQHKTTGHAQMAEPGKRSAASSLPRCSKTRA